MGSTFGLNNDFKKLVIDMSNYTCYYGGIGEHNMRFIGFISRQMIHSQDLNMMGPCGTKIKLQLSGLDALDLYTMVSVDDETNQIVIETLKEKRARYNGLYKQFVKESYANQAIVNI